MFRINTDRRKDSLTREKNVNKMKTDNELVLLIKENNLPVEKVEALVNEFSGFFVEAKQLALQARSIVVTGEDQVDLMKLAHVNRLQLQKIRTDAEKMKIKLKEQSLREGNAIQGVFNIIKALVVPVEEYLESQEKFVENLKAERELVIYNERLAKLSVYDPEASGYNLTDMSEYAFNKLLEGLKLGYEAAQEKLEREELEREEKEKAWLEEQEKIKAENEQLKTEALERERVLFLERQANEKIMAEIRVKKEAELVQIKAEEENKQKALLAPDKEKLINLAGVIEGICFPKFSSPKAESVAMKAMGYLGEVTKFIRESAEKL